MRENTCDEMRCVCLEAGRLRSSVAKLFVNNLLAQVSDKQRHEKQADVKIRWRRVWVV